MTGPPAPRLPLADVFPPVPTAAWDAQIRRDLESAGDEPNLVWNTDEGIAVRPYYRAEHVTPRDALPIGARAWQALLPGQEPALHVSAIEHHEAGATAVQEVAFALAQGADLLAAGRAVSTFGFSIGSNHFMEIAKLRATRRLWAEVTAAFASLNPGASVGGPIHIHARTAQANKTVFDPYVNLLRVTTEAFSAIVGGCDSLTITPCGFDDHLAENVHHILREETHLAAVTDPGAGSYYIEALTDALAARAWALFQEIEAAGGWPCYLASGAVGAALAPVRDAREQAVAARRRVLVGTNHYPDLGERRLDESERMAAGWRLASGFEALRLRTERHARATGRTPRVLLLERGDMAARKARAAFCLNLFGCAGFDIVQSDILTDADLVVLCGSSDDYVAFARDVCPRVTVPVVVAGNPGDRFDELRAAGVADVVHEGSDALDTLVRWQKRLGIG